MSGKSVNLMISDLDGKIHAYFTSHETEKEAQSDVTCTGSDEIVRRVLKFKPKRDSEAPAHDLIGALSRMNIEDDDSAARLLERMFTEVFKAGVEVGIAHGAKETLRDIARRQHSGDPHDGSPQFGVGDVGGG